MQHGKNKNQRSSHTARNTGAIITMLDHARHLPVRGSSDPKKETRRTEYILRERRTAGIVLARQAVKRWGDGLDNNRGVCSNNDAADSVCGNPAAGSGRDYRGYIRIQAAKQVAQAVQAPSQEA